MVKIGFKKLNKDAVLPVKAHESDSGFDLVACEDVIVEPGQTVIVPTGIAIQLPKDYEAQIRPRSGVTLKTKLRVQLGTIDQGYTGEIGVIVDNTSPEMFQSDWGCVSFYKMIDEGNFSHPSICVERGTYLICKGDRIAQLVIQKLPKVKAVEIKELNESDRGESGFGSSGTKAIYVAQLNSKKQEVIKRELEKSIKETGLYSEKEIVEHVNRAMESKIADLQDVIDIDKFI